MQSPDRARTQRRPLLRLARTLRATIEDLDRCYTGGWSPARVAAGCDRSYATAGTLSENAGSMEDELYSYLAAFHDW